MSKVDLNFPEMRERWRYSLYEATVLKNCS
jgi:hypothetical protein